MSGVNDLGPRGRRLWGSCLKRDPRLAEQANPDRAVALEACRIADLIDALQAAVDVEGVMLTDPVTGLPKVHPAVVEQNKARPLLARLLVALRMPDATTGEKPQRRGVRGAYAPRVAGKVSSLDRARERATG